eukprot:834478-Prymnesium_polylepis.2
MPRVACLVIRGVRRPHQRMRRLVNVELQRRKDRALEVAQARPLVRNLLPDHAEGARVRRRLAREAAALHRDQQHRPSAAVRVPNFEQAPRPHEHPRCAQHNHDRRALDARVDVVQVPQVGRVEEARRPRREFEQVC